MKRGILGLMMVLFVCTWASAESSVWKVQKDKNVIYLGATFHLLRQTDYPLPPEFDEAYRASDMLVFETDMLKLIDPSTQQMLLAKSMYTDGSTIADHLSAGTYAELSAYCDSIGIPLKVLKQFRPSMLMETLTAMELLKLGVTQQGVDMYYYGKAVKDHKKVEGLETVEEQIDKFISAADGKEDDYVRHSLDDMKTVKELFEHFAYAWRKGDESKMSELMVSEFKGKQPSLYRKLVTDRNNKWLPQIEAYINTPETEFILVGAGHLVGPTGIIEDLRNKGYLVDQLH